MKVEEILVFCASKGLDLVSVKLREDILILVPRDVETLPCVEVLEDIQQALRQVDGVRYVTLAQRSGVLAAP